MKVALPMFKKMAAMQAKNRFFVVIWTASDIELWHLKQANRKLAKVEVFDVAKASPDLFAMGKKGYIYVGPNGGEVDILLERVIAQRATNPVKKSRFYEFKIVKLGYADLNMMRQHKRRSPDEWEAKFSRYLKKKYQIMA